MSHIIQIAGEEFDLDVIVPHWTVNNPVSEQETTQGIISDLLKIEDSHPVAREAIEWILTLSAVKNANVLRP